MIRRIAIAATACALAASLPAATPAPRLLELDEILVAAKGEIRLEDFVEFPKYDRVAVSPDGSKVAMAWVDEMANYQRLVGILSYPDLKRVSSFALSGAYSQADIDWGNEEKVVLQPKWPLRAFLHQLEPIGVIAMTELRGGRFTYVNEEGLRLGDPIDTLRRDEQALANVPLSGEADGGKWPGRKSLGPVRLIQARYRADPNLLLFQTTRNRDRSGNGEGLGAFVLNMQDESETRIATLPVSGGEFVLGPQQQIALATGVNAQNEQVVYYLPPDARADGRNWQLAATSPAGERGLRPVAWTGQGEEYYALDGRGQPTRTVVVWNAADQTQRLLYRHPTADIDAVSLDPSGKAWMFQGNEHFPIYWYPDPEHPLAQLHQILAKKVNGEQVDIISASDDLSVAVTKVSSGRRPPVYMVVDVKAVSSKGGFFTYPTLRGTRLAPVDAIEFRSRDGLVIHGYLTTPEDASGRPLTGLPLVVIAHDGPTGDPAMAAYEYERQLFASRGYAVLQVNRRGSPGRGVAFERAGDGKWGAETQNDFIDAVRWAIRDGVADPERICFYGTGYGAYSAMVAAAHAPELFKCVVGVSGVYDLPALLGDAGTVVTPAMTQVLGTDMAEMKARSPVSLADSIKAEVLLMPQQKDQNFPTEQTSSMRTALKDAKNAPQVQLLGQEYGGQHSTSTRANGYKSILKFIDKQVGR